LLRLTVDGILRVYNFFRGVFFMMDFLLRIVLAFLALRVALTDFDLVFGLVFGFVIAFDFDFVFIRRVGFLLLLRTSCLVLGLEAVSGLDILIESDMSLFESGRGIGDGVL